MPFASYKNFQDCVNKNRSKGDPKAYCAVIMRKVENPGSDENKRDALKRLKGRS